MRSHYQHKLFPLWLQKNPNKIWLYLENLHSLTQELYNEHTSADFPNGRPLLLLRFSILAAGWGCTRASMGVNFYSYWPGRAQAPQISKRQKGLSKLDIYIRFVFFKDIVSLCSSGWAWNQWLFCLSLLTAGNTGVCHHAQLISKLLNIKYHDLISL